MNSCELLVVSPPQSDVGGGPVTVGIPLPSGWCSDPALLDLVGPEGRIPLQAAALNRWIDGSIRWLLLDFLATCPAGSSARYSLIAGARRSAAPASAVRVSDERDGVVVDTGAAQFVLGPGNRFPFRKVQLEQGSPLDCERTALVVTYSNGRVAPVVVTQVVVEERGPVRATVRFEGTCGRGGNQLDVLGRLTFWCGHAVARLSVTLRNPHAAHHPGGYWELGSGGAVYLKDVSLLLGLPAGPQELKVTCSVESAEPQRQVALPFTLHQDSSGGERWNGTNHIDRTGRVATSFRGFRLTSGESQSTGLRADPIVQAAWDGHRIAVAVPGFWQNFPKSISVDRDAIIVGLFPKRSSPQELQGGEQKTHELAIALGPAADGVVSALGWARNPLLVRAAPEWYAASGAVPYLVPESTDRDGDYLTLIRAALDGPNSFVAKRDAIDEYGWRHFGDLYADHEAVGHDGPEPFISHYNNQYDAIAGFAVHFMRSGDRRWWDLLQDLAAHVVDIDIYHTAGDKSAYNGGLFWHTCHYVDAGKSTHRSYPRRPGVPGGGPSNEQDYSSGLMLQYFLTGDLRYRDAVIGLGRWVLNMDDGRQTVFRWLDGGPTGFASQTSSPDYHGPGRGAAYSIETLLNAHRLTGEPLYLETAEALIRRSVHPHQDLASLNLLNAERRWHYTVFLQTLGRFLDYKRERGELTFMYDYARAVVLHYARWMKSHEYPYLDKPEILEYPTETWAAQDLRKSEVFMHAARYASGTEREAFLERAEFFFRNSIATLKTMGSRTFTRPVVLLLTNGYMRSWFLTEGLRAEPQVDQKAIDFGVPEIFVPQKARARRRVLGMAGVSGAAAMLSGLKARLS